MKHLKTVKPKQAYIKYRQDLRRQNVGSYIDQFGSVFTICRDCVKEDCPIRDFGPGCMRGEPSKEIAEKIGLNIKE